ncbi:MAG: NAD(P)-binding domain-containing protein [Pseudomonadota bacterium]
MAETLQTDYLIVGAGAMGMAFADVLVEETDADIVIVDRYGKPGGHWNVAYPFVTLHQPSSFYGVSSLELSKGRKDKTGLNAGLQDLASGAEVSAYFDEVMRHRLLPSGRVRYFPLCDYVGDGRFVSRLHGKAYQVEASKKTVDATYLNTSTPATHKPSFSIADGVRFAPVGELPSLHQPASGFVIIGGGKTGIDAVIWLLENGVDPDMIRWIMPRDGWLINRQKTQPSMEFFEQTMGGQADQMQAIAEAADIDDLFGRLEKAEVMFRIDQDIKPSMFHGATVSAMELEQLRRVKNIIRLGRVSAIEHDRIVLADGDIPTDAGQLHIDCSASAITNLETRPIFDGDTITPQTVRSYQPVFSAALIAHVEAAYETEEEKQALCQVVPLPNHVTDWPAMTAAFMMNQYRWSQDKALRAWLRDNRLDGFSELTSGYDKNDAAKHDIMQRLRANMMPAMANLQKLMASNAT